MGALEGSLEIAAVNLPFRPATGGRTESFLRLADQLGRLGSSLLRSSVVELRIDLQGIDDALHVPVTVAAVKGALTPFLGEAVNYVNAEKLAENRGIEIIRSTHTHQGDYAHLIGVTLKGDEGEIEVAGTLYGESDPRVVSILGFRLEFSPRGLLLILRNADVPGVVGMLGVTLGEAGINIADIHLAREDGEDDEGSAEALAVLRLDQAPSAELLEKLRSEEVVREVHLLDLG